MIDESDLLRLVEGECSPGEAAAIQAWVAADPHREVLLHELRALWRATGAASRDWNAAAGRERLLRARRLVLRARITPAAPSPAWSTRIAVAVALMAAAMLFWYLRPGNLPPTEFSSPAGQLSTLHLSDGSRALLGVATRLRVPRDYGARARAVELDGEAYFVVRHDPAHPFVVRTRLGTTEDIGTEFIVRAYRQEDSLQVVVAAGGVTVRSARRPGAVAATLRPGDRVVLEPDGGATVTSGLALDRYLAWTRGSLLFDDAPLATVLTQLERWYDLDIAPTDSSLAREHVTISFATKSADAALHGLAQVLDVRVTRAGRQVRLTPAHKNEGVMR